MSLLTRFPVVVLIFSLSLNVVADEQQRLTWEKDSVGYEKIVGPFFRKHCVDCHGPDDAEAELRLDNGPANDFLDLAAKGHWGEIVNVLNSHEMPPESEPQPETAEVARVVDWVTQQMAKAELMRRDSAIVLRRLNRDEYKNTIRDLTGVQFDVSGFPMDPSAGGFDNNGAALTVSPLHMELYFNAAREIVNQALTQGERPPTIKWRFQPESGDSDSNRVEYDGQRLIVNGGKNPVENGFKVMHHDRWDKKLNVRPFQLDHEGEYIIRIHAAGVVPDRDEVVESARNALDIRMKEQIQKNPKGEKWHREAFDRNLEHFRTDRMYDYGPPRLKLIVNLGGRPAVIDEFDVPASLNDPGTYEVRTRFTTEKAGITIQYAYSIPKVIENFWMQDHDSFARPELWVDWFELEGPVYEQWPPTGHKIILGELAGSADPSHREVETVIKDFMERAYRRPVTAEELATKMVLYDEARRGTDRFIEAVKSPLIAILISPEFLYLAEPNEQPASDGPHQTRSLDDFELASRLSYFLWSTMPDDALMDLAQRGALSNESTIHRQVSRLLEDPRSSEFVKNFAGQWLGLREVGANPPAEDLYPRYDRHLEVSIVEEAEAFFEYILRNDLDVMNLVKSDFVVINERLARFYGIPGVKGDHFRRVQVPNDVARGGIVTQASMLTITSNGTRTSPVKRGTWVMKNVLGIDPGIPVANAGDIAPKVPGIDKATVRQRLEIHRELPQCARCHNKIDPLGFALENFNAAGEYRTQEGFGYKGRIGPNDPIIDASAKLLDGTEFVGVNGLQDELVKQRELFQRCLAGKLFTFALGRELGIADRIHVQDAVDHLNENGGTLESLIQFIATSEPFLTK